MYGVLRTCNTKQRSTLLHWMDTHFVHQCLDNYCVRTTPCSYCVHNPYIVHRLAAPENCRTWRALAHLGNNARRQQSAGERRVPPNICGVPTTRDSRNDLVIMYGGLEISLKCRPEPTLLETRLLRLLCVHTPYSVQQRLSISRLLSIAAQHCE